MSTPHLSQHERPVHTKAVELAEIQLQAARGIAASHLKSLSSAELDQAAAAIAQTIATNYWALGTGRTE